MSPESQEKRPGLKDNFRILKETARKIILDVRTDPNNFILGVITKLVRTNENLYLELLAQQEKSQHPMFFITGAAISVEYQMAEDEILGRSPLKVSPDTLDSLRHESFTDGEVHVDIERNHQVAGKLLNFFLRDSKRGKNYPVVELFRGFIFVHRAWQAQRSAENLNKLLS